MDRRGYDQRLNTGVHGPALRPAQRPSLARAGDDILVRVPMFGDGAGAAGDVRTPTTARTVLTRDGKQVGETARPAFGELPVPADAGAYRLEATLTHEASELSTAVSTAWTFRSSHVDGAPKLLPLSVIRFQPKLSDTDSARVGMLRVPLVVQQQEGTPQMKRIEVEASFDDGKTWQAVPVVGNNAMVWNSAPGFASLRARGVDASGNTSEVTLIRAYRVTG